MAIVLLVFSFSGFLLRDNSYAMIFTLLKYTFNGFQSICKYTKQPSLLYNSRTFSSPHKETLCPVAVTLHSPLPPVPGNH